MVKKYEIRGEDGNLKSITDEIKKLTMGDEDKAKEALVTPTKKKSHAKMVLFGTIAAIVVLTSGIILFAKGLADPGVAKYAVPRVIGMNVRVAQDTVRKAKLRAIVTYAAAGKGKAGTVITTKPAAGTRLGDGGTVTLIVAGRSSNPPPQPIPDTPAPEKRPTIEDTPAPDPGTKNPPDDQALHITVGPKPGDSVKTTTPATDEKIEMPDIEGMVDAKARKKLEDLGLQVEASVGEDAALPPGVVLASDPKPGTRVEKGAIVRLRINTHKDQEPAAGGLSVVKNYVGGTAAAAAQDLKAQGLTPVIAYEATRLHRSGAVIRTNPPAGSQLPRGSQVTLFVAQ